MRDRTTKLIFLLIILGLWGLLLRPVFSPVTARAQQGAQIQDTTRMVINPVTGVLYFAPADGNLYLFDPNTLQLRARAVYVPSQFDPRTHRLLPPTFSNP